MPSPIGVKLRRSQCEQMSSDLILRADIAQYGQYVSKGAKPGSGLCLFDHLVRTGEKGCRNLDTEQFRCLEIDGKQEFGGLLRSLEVCGLTGQINPTRIIR
jgi:hypothetical protein